MRDTGEGNVAGDCLDPDRSNEIQQGENDSRPGDPGLR